MAKALSHPIRVRALEILNQRVASPSDIAKQLDLPVANVSYHVNTLLRLKCIEEVETRHVRGAIEHLYRATRRPTALLEDWKEMPVNAKNAMASEIGRVAFDDLRRALARESFGERSNEHFTFTRLVLDEEGWQEVYDILVETLDRVMAVHAQSAARLAEDGGERAALRSVLSMFHYESPAADNS
ncbi:MAG TPA: winged helix-turn-helix domain-containing protein [Capillimicrobium sp.]|nr:winged helix-turn-helix domain-containing protein [Capillimicrobium sp.]